MYVFRLVFGNSQGTIMERAVTVYRADDDDDETFL